MRAFAVLGWSTYPQSNRITKLYHNPLTSSQYLSDRILGQFTLYASQLEVRRYAKIVSCQHKSATSSRRFADLQWSIAIMIVGIALAWRTKSISNNASCKSTFLHLYTPPARIEAISPEFDNDFQTTSDLLRGYTRLARNYQVSRVGDTILSCRSGSTFHRWQQYCEATIWKHDFCSLQISMFLTRTVVSTRNMLTAKIRSCYQS